MYCTRCGQENSDDARFCHACGKDLTSQTPGGTPRPGTPLSDMSGGPTLVPGGTPIRSPAPVTFSGGQTASPGTPGWNMDPGASSLGLRPGDVVAERFEVLEVLGQGGMGAVFKVQDTELDQVRAMKVIKPELIQRPDMQERFRNEVKLCQQLNHPGIVRIYDYWRDRRRDLSFYTMELVDGQTLRLWLSIKVREGKQVTPGEFKIIAQGLCEPLIEAHKVTIHRDLKPENVMIERATKRLKLMDFGIAKTLHPSGQPSSSMSLQGGGTPYYVAPEQERGEKVDQRADMYSLGVMLYEILTGEVLHGGSPSLSEERKDLPVAISEIIARATDRRPDRRFENVSALLEALRKAMESPSAPRESPKPNPPQNKQPSAKPPPPVLGMEKEDGPHDRLNLNDLESAGAEPGLLDLTHLNDHSSCGSGLLDLTRDCDDSSLGAELLAEIDKMAEKEAAARPVPIEPVQIRPRPPKTSLVISFPGASMLMDKSVKVWLDDKLLGQGSITKGFSFSAATAPGNHTLRTNHGALAGESNIPFSIPKVGSFRLELQLSRLLMRFKLKSLTQAPTSPGG